MLVGEDFRALIVDNKIVAIAERTPAHIVGDGNSTIQQLIDEVNEDPRRGYGHEKVLTQIEVDASTEKLLSKGIYARNRFAERRKTGFENDGEYFDRRNGD